MNTMQEQEELRQAAQILMENRWITRKDMPEEYLLIRHHEKKLRQFFRDKCGWPLLVTAGFYKLEKIPAIPHSFMGLNDLQTVEDYVLLACVMAFLEEYDSGGQFLLGNLTEALLSYYPEEPYSTKLNWEDYNHRKALIRVMRFLADEGIIRVIDDESDAFLSTGIKDGIIAGDALYEVTVLTRYFLRSFPQKLQDYDSLEQLQKADFIRDTSDEAEALRQRRNRIYREILLSPVYYRSDDTENDFLYIRNFRSKLAPVLEDWFGVHLELYKNAVMAVSYEQSTWFKDIFPIRFRGIHDVILHLSLYMRLLSDKPRPFIMTMSEWESHLKAFKFMTGSGWTKEYREMRLKKLSETLLYELESWGMCRKEDEIIYLMPALFRIEGQYPEQYQNTSNNDKKHKLGENNESKQMDT